MDTTAITTAASAHNVSLSPPNSTDNQSDHDRYDHETWLQYIAQGAGDVRHVLLILSVVANLATILTLLPSPPGGRRHADRGRRVLPASRRLVLSLCASDLLWSVVTLGQPLLGLHTARLSDACVSICLRRLRVAARIASLLNILGLALDVYCAISRPLQHRALSTGRVVRVAVPSLWLLAFIPSYVDLIVPVFPMKEDYHGGVENTTSPWNWCRVLTRSSYETDQTVVAFTSVVVAVILPSYLLTLRNIRPWRFDGGGGADEARNAGGGAPPHGVAANSRGLGTSQGSVTSGSGVASTSCGLATTTQGFEMTTNRTSSKSNSSRASANPDTTMKRTLAHGAMTSQAAQPGNETSANMTSSRGVENSQSDARENEIKGMEEGRGKNGFGVKKMTSPAVGQEEDRGELPLAERFIKNSQRSLRTTKIESNAIPAIRIGRSVGGVCKELDSVSPAADSLTPIVTAFATGNISGGYLSVNVDKIIAKTPAKERVSSLRKVSKGNRLEIHEDMMTTEPVQRNSPIHPESCFIEMESVSVQVSRENFMTSSCSRCEKTRLLQKNQSSSSKPEIKKSCTDLIRTQQQLTANNSHGSLIESEGRSSPCTGLDLELLAESEDEFSVAGESSGRRSGGRSSSEKLQSKFKLLEQKMSKDILESGGSDSKTRRHLLGQNKNRLRIYINTGHDRPSYHPASTNETNSKIPNPTSLRQADVVESEICYPSSPETSHCQEKSRVLRTPEDSLSSETDSLGGEPQTQMPFHVHSSESTTTIPLQPRSSLHDSRSSESTTTPLQPRSSLNDSHSSKSTTTPLQPRSSLHDSPSSESTPLRMIRLEAGSEAIRSGETNRRGAASVQRLVIVGNDHRPIGRPAAPRVRRRTRERYTRRSVRKTIFILLGFIGCYVPFYALLGVEYIWYQLAAQGGGMNIRDYFTYGTIFELLVVLNSIINPFLYSRRGGGLRVGQGYLHLAYALLRLLRALWALCRRVWRRSRGPLGCGEPPDQWCHCRDPLGFVRRMGAAFAEMCGAIRGRLR